MTKHQARRLLLVALALSLLIHLAIAWRFRWSYTQPQESVQVEKIVRIRAVRIARQTPPPFTPSPQPSPQVKAKNPKPLGVNGTGAQLASAPTPAPTPVASATPNCVRNDTPASMTATPDPPAEIPATARSEAKNGTSSIQVKIDANGAVAAATVTGSSGSSSLDLIAEDLARHATYAPATHQCKPIASEYVFTAKWSAW